MYAPKGRKMTNFCSLQNPIKQLIEAVQELSLSSRTCFSPDTRRKIQDKIHSDFLGPGSCGRSSPQIFMVIEVVSATNGLESRAF